MMTITEKILARGANKKSVSPGDIIEVNVDNTFTHDVFAVDVINGFYKLNNKVFDKNKIKLIVDHDIPACREDAVKHVEDMIKFSDDQEVKLHLGDGICHQIMIEKGYALPGQIILGTDSHTVTYGAMGAFSTGIGSTEMSVIFSSGKIWLKVPETIKIEASGKLQKGVYSKDIILHLAGIIKIDGATYKTLEFSKNFSSNLSLSSRLTMCNMGVEMGAKNAIFEPDNEIRKYIESKFPDKIKDSIFFESDIDSKYSQIINLKLDEIEPMLSGPKNVDDVKPLQKLKGQKITQAFIGSCTNGRLEDIEVAASILNGKKIKKGVRFIVTPASNEVYIAAMELGYLKILIEAGAMITNSYCGFCSGMNIGQLSANDVCIASNNRNFPGRLGHKNSQVYLASPASVAASAIKGEISDPRDIIF